MSVSSISAPCLLVSQDVQYPIYDLSRNTQIADCLIHTCDLEAGMQLAALNVRGALMELHRRRAISLGERVMGVLTFESAKQSIQELRDTVEACGIRIRKLQEKNVDLQKINTFLENQLRLMEEQNSRQQWSQITDQDSSPPPLSQSSSSSSSSSSIQPPKVGAKRKPEGPPEK